MNNIQLPDSLTDCFRQYRGASDENYWHLGDAVDSAVVELAGRVTARRIYQVAAVESEYSIPEVRLLHETARATPASLRDEFDGALVHQHYRAVRYLEPDKQHYYLKWAVESADAYGGRPAPASILAKRIRKDLGTEPPPPTPAELWERAEAALYRVLDADKATLLRGLVRFCDELAEDAQAAAYRDRLAMAGSELAEAAKEAGERT